MLNLIKKIWLKIDDLNFLCKLAIKITTLFRDKFIWNFVYFNFFAKKTRLRIPKRGQRGFELIFFLFLIFARRRTTLFIFCRVICLSRFMKTNSTNKRSIRVSFFMFHFKFYNLSEWHIHIKNDLTNPVKKKKKI